MTGGAGGSLWRKAPLVLRHFPGVLGGIIGATAILALAAASAPLFFSSASNLAVARRVNEVSPWQAGLMLRMRAAAASDEVFTNRHRAVTKLARDIDHLGNPVTTMLAGSSIQPVGGEQASPVQAVARSGARAHIQLLARLSEGHVDVVPGRVADPLRDCAGRRASSDRPGVLMADSLAMQLQVCPGDEVVVAGSAQVPVAGVYRDLRAAPRDVFWDLLAPQYEPEIAPTFLLMGSSTFQELASRFDGAVLYRWEAPVEVHGLTFGDAQALADRLRVVISEVNSGTDLLAPNLFPAIHADSLLLNIRSVVEQMVSRSRAPVNFLALGGTLLALGVTAAAGTYASHRRRTEFALLHTRGVAPAVLGTRSSLEALLPAAAGCFVGWSGAIGIVRLLGPADLLGSDALAPALGRAAVWVAAGTLLLGVVTAVGSRARTGMSLPRARRALLALPWDVGLLVLAYLTWRRLSLTAAQASSDTSRTLEVDVLVFVFPMLFVAGVTGLVSRVLRALLPRLRVSGTRLRPPLFLALRRLAAAPAIALTLVLIAAVSIGAFMYAGILATSGRATVEAKALTFVGSDVSVPLPPHPEVPEGVNSPATIVSKVSQLRLMPGAVIADVLGIDPETFARVAFWDDSFSDEPLERLVQRIRWDPSSDAVPAMVTGLATDQRDMTLENSEDSIGLQVLETVRSFPGIFSTRPMVIVDRRALEPREGGAGGTTVAGAGASYEMWLAGRPGSIIDELARAGVSLEGSLTATAVEDTPSLLPLEWSFGFLQGLGAVSGFMALVGILLYLQARQTSRVVAAALVARMGLSRQEHALSIATELALMLLVAFSLGTTLSAVAANLVYDLIDPLPIVPPPPLLRIPTELVVYIAALLVATALAGAWRVQRAADRANVAEVLRVAA